jgi:ketosteroid isomerase-like protein
MTEESTTPDLVRLARQAYEAVSRGDFDAVMSLFAADAVYDLSDAGLGTFEGVEAIRRFFEDWHGSWEEGRFEEEEMLALGTASCLSSFGRVAAWSAAMVASSSDWRNSLRGRTAESSGSRTTVT